MNQTSQKTLTKLMSMKNIGPDITQSQMTQVEAFEIFQSNFTNIKKPFFEILRILYAPVYFKRDEFSAMRFDDVERLSVVSSDSEDEDEDKSEDSINKMELAIQKLKTGFEEEDI